MPKSRTALKTRGVLKTRTALETRTALKTRAALKTRVAPTIRVLLIEDNRLLREGVTAMLNDQPDIKTVSSAGNGDAMEKARTFKPHVVLLDLGLRSQNSLKIAEHVKREFPKCEVVLMDLIPIHSEVVEFVKLGVSGFILKDATIDDFLHTIRSVAEGKKVLPPLLTETLFSHIVKYALQTGKHDTVLRAVKLTRREQEIIGLIARGMSNKEISGELSIAVHTVKSHVHNTLEKLALHTRLELASFALRPDSKVQAGLQRLDSSLSTPLL